VKRERTVTSMVLEPGERPDMNNRFFEQPVLNSPYEYPARHWELDDEGQPTQQIIESRRRAEFITPIPKPRKRKGSAKQLKLVFRRRQRAVNPGTAVRSHPHYQ